MVVYLPHRRRAFLSRDPHFSNVVLLLNMQGTAGSTTFTDSSTAQRTITANGGAQISDAASPFAGQNSAHIPGASNSFLSVPDSPDFAMGNVWTIETWVRITSWVNATNYVSLMGQRGNDVSSWYYHIFNGQGGGYGSAFEIRSGGGGVIMALMDTNASNALNLNQWYYLAIVSTGSQINSYVSGSLVRSVSTASGIGDNPLPLTIGRLGLTGEKYDGYIGPLRITRGVARDVTVVPTGLFPTR